MIQNMKMKIYTRNSLEKLTTISIFCGNSCFLWHKWVALATLPGGSWGPSFLHEAGEMGWVLIWAALKAEERLGEIVMPK